MDKKGNMESGTGGQWREMGSVLDGGVWGIFKYRCPGSNGHFGSGIQGGGSMEL